MQLGQTEALGMLDHHQAGVGHIDADLDHRGGHQHLHLAAGEQGHHGGFLGAGHAAAQQADHRAGQGGAELLVRFGGVAQVECFALLDQRADPVHLLALRHRRGCAGSASRSRRLEDPWSRCAPPLAPAIHLQYSGIMKQAMLPPVRVPEDLRAAAENVLAEGETLSSFIQESVTRAIELRRVQASFNAKADASLERFRRTGRSVRASEVVEVLQGRLDRRRAEMGK